MSWNLPKGSQVTLGISQIHSEGSQSSHILTKSVLEGHICKSFYRANPNQDLAEIKESFMTQMVVLAFEPVARDTDMTVQLFLSTICIWPYILPVSGSTGRWFSSPDQSSRNKTLYYMDAIIPAALLNLISQNLSISQAASYLRRSPVQSPASKVDQVAQSFAH